jgi:hypothetical protein
MTATQIPGYRWLTGVLILLLVFLLVANVASIYSAFIDHKPFSFAWRFYFDKGYVNLPGFFAYLLMFITAFYAGRLYYSSPLLEGRVFWRNLMFFILFMTIDKWLHLHNQVRTLSLKTIASLDPSSAFHYLWLIPYATLFVWFIISSRQHFMVLPYKLRKRVLLSVSLYLFGAVVVEAVGSYYWVSIGRKIDLNVMLIKTAEETVQMAACIILIHSLASYHHRKQRDGEQNSIS